MGAFSDLTTLTPQPGVVPYETNVSFWSDHADKRRWFAIRSSTTDSISYSATGNWAFPTGSVWVKHFDINTVREDPSSRIKLETRVLVKTTSGIYGLTYKWRADQTDADLVPSAGLSEVIPGSVPQQTWRFPGRGECLTCHTAAGGYALLEHVAMREGVMANAQLTNYTIPTSLDTPPIDVEEPFVSAKQRAVDRFEREYLDAVLSFERSWLLVTLTSAS